MLCAVCQKKAETICPSCKIVHYCSRDCQEKDWKSHDKWCNVFIIKENDGLKPVCHSVFAAKDLECGDYILEELPLFQIVRSHNSLENPEHDKNVSHFCVTCGTNLSTFLIGKCAQCKFPVCPEKESGKNCEEHKIHAENECGILASKQIDYDSLTVHEDRRILLILRAGAVKQKNPDLWNELMKRADEIVATGQDSDFNREEISKLEEAMKKLDISNEDMKMYTQFFSLLNLTLIYEQTSASRVNLEGKDVNQLAVGDFLFPLANYFSHSCTPNCNFAIDGYPEFKIQIRAARSIKKGEELTIGNLLVPLFEGINERRLIIKERFGCLCKCVRCSDPTEFGTCFSGIVCTHCRPQHKNQNPSQVEENIGYFLPLNPEPESEGGEKEKDSSPLVQCNGCQTIRSYSFFKDQLHKMKEELLENNETLALFTKEEFLLEVEKMKRLLSEYSGKILHPNHFIIYKIHENLSLIYQHGLGISSSLGEEMIERKSIWEGFAQSSKIQLAIESKLLNGALSFHQAYLQKAIASGFLMVVEIEHHAHFLKSVAMVLDIVDKLKEIIKLSDSAKNFQEKQMPTTFKPKIELELVKKNLQSARGLLDVFTPVYEQIQHIEAEISRLSAS